MKAEICHCVGHGVNVLHYNNVKRVIFNKDDNKCIVELHDNYTVWMNEHDKTRKPSNFKSEEKAKKILQSYNVSTIPYCHVLCDVFEVEIEA